MELWGTVLCSLLLLSDIYYTGASPCKSGCTGSAGSTLNLKPGTTYVYSLDGQTQTSVPKTGNSDSATLNLHAKVEVSVQQQCATLIKLKSVEVSGSGSKKHSNLAKLEVNPLRVLLNGGILSDEACAVPEDDYTSLNIKRAVASLLQIAATETSTVTETDVFGTCKTNYNVRKDGDVTTVLKQRDLNKCAYREAVRQDIFAIPQSGSSIFQSSPLLSPSFDAEIKVKDGVVQSATVQESYFLRPFSDRDNGAKTTVTTTLKLESTSGAAIPDTTKESRSVIFENPHETVTSSIQTVINALHKVVDGSENSVSDEVARNFAELVTVIRHASADDLLSVYGQVKAGANFKNKQLAKKAYADALFRSGSGDSVAVAVELLKSKELDGEQAKLWFLSFAFVRHASSKALEKAATLLDEPNLPREAYLGVGALAGRYCQDHVCDNVPALNNLLKKLATPLSNTHPTTRSEEDKIVGSLKALRNVRKLSEEVAVKVAALIVDRKTPTRVRAAALETSHSYPCCSKMRKAAADVLNNREEDSELRIKAYLSIVECPNEGSADKLTEFLKTENVNQVGAFITSHLRNLRASANPNKQKARELLKNVHPPRKYPFDIRKYSQNYEISYDIDSLSSAATAESNVIFSQKGYLPRSVNLNLTAEVFGQAFNLLEVTGRAENLERVVEKFLGYKSYLRRHPEKLYEDSVSEMKSFKQLLEEKYKRLTRSKRSANDISAKTQAFAKKVHLFDSEVDNNIDLDLSLRLLGNELIWVNLGEKNAQRPQEIVDKIADVLEKGFGKVKDFDTNIQNHAVFLDSELAYPTSIGLPVKLTATGTSVAHLKAAGNLNLGALLKDPKNGKLKFELRPSASVEIIGQLSVDGYALESGIKLAGRLHTATGSEVSIKMLDGHGVDVHIGLPVKKSDILTVTTEVLSVVRERGHPAQTKQLTFSVPRKDFQGCFDQLQPVIGLTLCGNVGFPNDAQALTSGAALYPLNGHSKLSVHLDKEDDSLTSYHFKAYYDINNPQHRKLEILIETPGSKTPREISFLAEAKTVPNKELNLKLVTPIYDLKGQLKVVDNDKEYSVSGLINMDGTNEFKTRLGLLINGAVYTPVFEVQQNKNSLVDVKVEGSVKVEKTPGSDRKKYIFNSVSVGSPQGKYSIDGNLITDNKFFQSDVKVGYGPETYGIKSKVQYSDSNIKVSAEFKPSHHADLGFALKYEFQRDDNHLENSLVVVHGNDLNSKDSKISIFQQINYKVTSIHQFDVSTKNTASYPLVGLDVKLEGAATQKSLSYDLSGKFEKNSVSSKLSAKVGVNSPGDYEIDFQAYAQGHGGRIELSRKVVNVKNSKFNNKLTLSSGDAYTLDADVKHQLERNNIDTGVVASVKIPRMANPYILDIGATANPSKVASHVKVTLSGKVVIDAYVKQNLAESASSGSFQLNIVEAIQSSGQYKKDANKASGDATFNLLPLNRKIKGTADLSVNGIKYAGVIEVLYDADKDPSKKLHIDTDTDVTRRSINSKNKLSLDGQELLVDFNGEAQGKPGNGVLNGGYDITLPGGQHFVARVENNIHTQPEQLNAEFFTDIGYSLKKGTPLTKLTVTTRASKVDLRSFVFDTQFEAKLTCESGDIVFVQSLKSLPNGEKLEIEAETALKGSRVGQYSFKGQSKASLSKQEITWHSSANVGEEASFDWEGKIHTGINDKIRSFENKLRAKVLNKNLKAAGKLRLAEGQGKNPCQFATAGELYINDLGAKGNLEATIGTKDGNAIFKVESSALSEPVTGDFKYKTHQAANALHKGEGTLKLYLGKEKHVDTDVKVNYNDDLSVLNTQFTWVSKVKEEKKASVSVAYKRISTTSHSGEIKLALDNNKVDINGKLDVTPNRPILDLNGVVNGDKYRYYAKFERKSDRHVISESQVVWANNGGGQAESQLVANFESPENFVFLIKLNSEKLNWNKIKVELTNKPNKGNAANRVTFAAQNGAKQGVTGSASYAFKEHENGYSIEGKGSANVNGENHPLTYKLSVTTPPDGRNKAYKISIDFVKGSFLLDNKYKNENHELSSVLKICFQKECFDQTMSFENHLQHLEEFDEKLVYKLHNTLNGRSDHVEYVYNTQMKLNSLDSKIKLVVDKYTANLHSYANLEKAGIVLTLPSREVAAVATYTLPNSKNGYKQDVALEASFFPNRKKSPADKTTLVVKGDLKKHNEEYVLHGEAKVSHPKLPKDLSVSGSGAIGKNVLRGKVQADVLNKKNDAIAFSFELSQNPIDHGNNVTAKASVASKGLTLDIGGTGHVFQSNNKASFGAFLYYVDAENLKKDAGVLLEASLQRIVIFAKVPGRELVNGAGKFGLKTDVKTLDFELTLAEGETGVLNVKFTPIKELKATLSPKSNPNRKLVGVITLTPTILEVKAERIEDGKVELLARGEMHVDKPNLFKTDYEIKSENIRKTVVYFENLSNELVHRAENILKQLIDELAKELKILGDVLTNARIDLEPLITHYYEALESLRKEIESDPNVGALAKAILHAMQQPIELALKLTEVTSKFINNDLRKHIQLIKNSFEDFDKTLRPHLKKIIEGLTKLSKEISAALTDHALALFQHAAEVLKQHEKDIKAMLNKVSDAFRELGLAVIDLIDQVKHEVSDATKLVIDQLNVVPILTDAQEKIHELLKFELPEHFWELYKEMALTIEDTLPTPELKNLAHSIFDYIEKILRKQAVDNEVELKKIASQAASAGNAIIAQLKTLIGADKNVGLLGLNFKLPLPASTVLQLPELGNIRFSPLSLLTQIGDFPTPLDFLYTYRPRLQPHDILPPFTAYGAILNSHHFITFDRKHFAFKGSCSYILAQDFLDGNFSVTVNLDNGKIKSITVSDSEDSLEVLADTKVILNGKPTEFPVHSNEISGWRRYNSVNVKHGSGVFITKYIARDIYIVRIAGYYHGRTRGLLGTITNEQYDEFQLPNGHISANIAEFANAYKVDGSCADVPESKHAGTHSPECTKLFTYESPLRIYFGAIPAEPYREACDQHAAMLPNEAKRAACDVAAGYVASLRAEGIPFAAIPPECAQCTINGKKVEQGHVEEVKPSKKADIVLVVEQSKQNEVVFKELVTPLITTLTTDLKEKGFADTEFSLIGYGNAEQKWPSHYGNNGKNTYSGNSEKLEWSDPEKVQPPYDTTIKRLKLIKRFIDTELGLEQIVLAMNEANNYPFREGATRVIVLINTTPCNRGPLFPFSLQIPRTLGIYKFYRDNQLNFFIISPLAGLAHNKPELKPKSIVGFDIERIYYTSDAKKESVGETVGRPDLAYEDDLCLSFSQVYGNAAFSSQNFIDSKPDQRKRFVEVVSQRITKDAASKEIANECACSLKSGISPIVRCSYSGGR